MIVSEVSYLREKSVDALHKPWFYWALQFLFVAFFDVVSVNKMQEKFVLTLQCNIGVQCTALVSYLQ
jgi:hypothetical protein